MQQLFSGQYYFTSIRKTKIRKSALLFFPSLQLLSIFLTTLPLKPSVVVSLVYVTPSCFQSNWRAQGKNVLTDILGFFSFVPKSGWFFHMTQHYEQNKCFIFFWAGLFLISKNNRIQKASFFAAALSDRSFIDVIAFTFAPHWLVKTSKILCEFHWFMIGWNGSKTCSCDWLCNIWLLWAWSVWQSCD